MPAGAKRAATPPTVLSSWTRILVSALEERGVDVAKLLAEAGLDPGLVQSPSMRVPLAANTRLWRLAARETGDESLGLWASRHASHTTFHALGYAFMASNTLRDALNRLVRFNDMVSNAACSVLTEQRGTSTLAWRMHPGREQPAEEAMEATIAVLLRSCRRLAGRDFAPVRVGLVRARPRKVQPFQDFFRCEVAFGEPRYTLVLSSESLDRPLAGGNEELARFNDRMVEEYLARLELGSVATRLRALLIRELPGGLRSHEEYAAKLHMSGRSLQRRLSAEGTSFTRLLRETRCDLARSYLGAPRRHSLTEVAFLLGFSDTSSFSRAFCQWTGKPPSAYLDAQP